MSTPFTKYRSRLPAVTPVQAAAVDAAQNALAQLKLVINPSKFKYNPLPAEKNEIRLVRVFPRGRFDARAYMISCELFHADLDDPSLVYKALSYTWGTPEDGQYTIRLNGQSIQIGRNLHYALRRLQNMVEPVVIWIDALCINQEDILERNMQVPKMKMIYERAQQVVLWLGVRPNASKAFSIVRELYEHKDDKAWITKKFEKSGTVRSLDYLTEMLVRPYWDRMWILQELTVARDVLILCSDEKIDFENFLAVQVLLKAIISPGPDQLDGPAMEILSDHVSLAQQISLGGPMQVKRWRDNWAVKDLTYFDCLEYNGFRRATNPLDLIYGFMAMIETKCPYKISVDYNKTAAQLFTEVTKAELNHSQMLTIVSRRQGKTPKGFASWVPDFEMNSMWPLHAPFEDIGEPEANFSASGDSKAQFTMNERYNTLTIRGLVVGSISELGAVPKAVDPNDVDLISDALKQWWPMVSSFAKDSLAAQEVFAQTLLCNKIADDNIAQWKKPEFLRAFLGAFAQLLKDDNPRVKDILDDSLIECVRFNKAKSKEITTSDGTEWTEVNNKYVWRTWIHEATHYCWDRRFCFVERNDEEEQPFPTMALVDQECQKGDKVVVAFGCRTPLLLREFEKGKWALLGDAYIHGFMYGEAIQMLERGQLKVEEFELF